MDSSIPQEVQGGFIQGEPRYEEAQAHPYQQVPHPVPQHPMHYPYPPQLYNGRFDLYQPIKKITTTEDYNFQFLEFMDRMFDSVINSGKDYKDFLFRGGFVDPALLSKCWILSESMMMEMSNFQSQFRRKFIFASADRVEEIIKKQCFNPLSENRCTSHINGVDCELGHFMSSSSRITSDGSSSPIFNPHHSPSVSSCKEEEKRNIMGQRTDYTPIKKLKEVRREQSISNASSLLSEESDTTEDLDHYLKMPRSAKKDKKKPVSPVAKEDKKKPESPVAKKDKTPLSTIHWGDYVSSSEEERLVTQQRQHVEQPKPISYAGAARVETKVPKIPIQFVYSTKELPPKEIPKEESKVAFNRTNFPYFIPHGVTPSPENKVYVPFMEPEVRKRFCEIVAAYYKVNLYDPAEKLTENVQRNPYGTYSKIDIVYELMKRKGTTQKLVDELTKQSMSGF